MLRTKRPPVGFVFGFDTAVYHGLVVVVVVCFEFCFLWSCFNLVFTAVVMVQSVNPAGCYVLFQVLFSDGQVRVAYGYSLRKRKEFLDVILMYKAVPKYSYFLYSILV